MLHYGISLLYQPFWLLPIYTVYRSLAVNVFLTGATGFVGRHALRRLRRDGHNVIACVRNPDAATALQAAGAQVFAGTLQDSPSLLSALRGCDAVVHCAAQLRMWGPWEEFERNNVSLTRSLLDCAQRAGVAHFVHISAASVVMQAPEAQTNVDESAPTTVRRDLPYSCTKAMAEALVLAAASPTLRTLALRPPLTWGPGDLVDGQLGERIAAGRFAWFSGGRYAYATCHVNNLCEAIALSLNSRHSAKAYFITDGEAAELRDFLSRRIAARGLKVPLASVPTSAAWAVAGAFESAWRQLNLSSEPPLTRETVRLMGHRFTLNTQRAQVELGYRPIITLAAGLESLAQQKHVGNTNEVLQMTTREAKGN